MCVISVFITVSMGNGINIKMNGFMHMLKKGFADWMGHTQILPMGVITFIVSD